MKTRYTRSGGGGKKSEKLAREREKERSVSRALGNKKERDSFPPSSRRRRIPPSISQGVPRSVSPALSLESGKKDETWKKQERKRERETNKWHVQRQKSEREKERERESLCTVDTTMPPKAVRSSGTTKERNVAICVRVLARLTQRAPSIFGRAFFGSRERARVLNARVWPDFERSDGINGAPG